MSAIRCAWFVAASFIVLAACPVQAVDLVLKGKPVATIVASVDREAENKDRARGGKRRNQGDEGDEALAVKILVDWIKKITDVELPVASSAPRGQPAVYVGQAAVAAGLKLDDIDSPSHEGLRIVADRQPRADRRPERHRHGEGGLPLPRGTRLPLLYGWSVGRSLSAHAEPLGRRRCRSPRSPGLLMRNPKGPSWGGREWKLWNGGGGENIQHAHAWKTISA